ncbi:MAG: hypothetical protein WEE36_02875 [Acidimicrobiia bacterium]
MESIIKRAAAVLGAVVAVGSLVAVLVLAGSDHRGLTLESVDAVAAAGIDLTAEQPLDAFQATLISVASHERNLAVAACMTSAGFPQLESVQDAWFPGNPFPGLRVERGAFGPDSPTDAMRYGYMPNFLRDRGPEPPQVVSYEPEYEQALDDCVGAIRRELGSAHDDAVSDFMDLGNQLVREFGSSLSRSDEVVLAFSDWLACMSDRGYQGGTVNEYLTSMHPPSFFGVPTGKWTGSGPEHTSGDSGVEILVPDQSVYEPSWGEAQLGVADADCKIATNLWGRVFPVLMTTQSAIVNDHAGILATATSRIHDAIDAAESVRSAQQSP